MRPTGYSEMRFSPKKKKKKKKHIVDKLNPKAYQVNCLWVSSYGFHTNIFF